MHRILLVDDEKDLVWAVQHSLRSEGYDVLTAYDGAEALLLARAYCPDLIVLDIVMPRLNGLEVCDSLRRDPLLAGVPILFLSVRSSVEDRLAGLEVGGDDYLTKPFDLRELKLRVGALCRRSTTATHDTLSRESHDPSVWGPFALNPNTRQVQIGSRITQLTRAEFDLLHFLMAHAGEIFPSEQLLLEVWHYPPESADAGLVRGHVLNLRAKIEPDPAHPIYLRTIPHQGYILLAPTQP